MATQQVLNPIGCKRLAAAVVLCALEKRLGIKHQRNGTIRRVGSKREQVGPGWDQRVALWCDLADLDAEGVLDKVDAWLG